MGTDLEDSVSLDQLEHALDEQQSQYRRLRRLKHVQDVEQVPLYSASPPLLGTWSADASDPQTHADYVWDEEDEYAEQLERGGAGKSPEASVNSQDDNAVQQDVKEDGYIGGDITADTQRLLRGQAKFDSLGKGHEPVIKPLMGVLSKLKQHAEQVKARAVAPPQKAMFDAARAKGLALSAGDTMQEVEEDLELVSDEVTSGEHPSVSANMCSNGNAHEETDEEEEGKTASTDDDRTETASLNTNPHTSDQETAVEPCDGPGGLHSSIHSFSRLDSVCLAHGPHNTGQNDNHAKGPSEINAVERLMHTATARAVQNVPKAMKQAARFYEMEAELSDEDGGAMVSDDEDEGDEREQGYDLAGLIDTAPQAMATDDAQQKQLHAAWEAEQEAAALKRLVEGVRTGFRRIGDQFGDDGDVQLARLRRAAGYEDDEIFNPALLDIDALLHGGGLSVAGTSGEDDGVWIQAFKRRKALTTMCMQPRSGDNNVQQDEQAVMVDELLHAATTHHDGLQRMGSSSNGEPPVFRAGSQQLDRRSSFLGRAGSTKTTINLTSGNSRSYVFGRDECSRDAALQQENNQPDDAVKQQTAAPTSFVGLRGQIEAMKGKRKGAQLLGVLHKGGGHSSASAVDVEGVLKEFSTNAPP